jgi:hypothetical protein
MNIRNSLITFRRVALAAAIVGGGIAGSSGAASADLISDIVGGTAVGGSSGPGYYSAAQYYAQTICTGSTNRVATTVVGAPRSGSGGQWFQTRVWARDVTSVAGAWRDYGSANTWVLETHSMSYSMPDYRPLATQAFTGSDGRSYQIYISVAVAVGNAWQSLPSSYSNHFTTFGAPQTNIYGVAVQGMPGASASYCKVM